MHGLVPLNGLVMLGKANITKSTGALVISGAIAALGVASLASAGEGRTLVTFRLGLCWVAGW